MESQGTFELADREEIAQNRSKNQISLLDLQRSNGERTTVFYDLSNGLDLAAASINGCIRELGCLCA